MKAIEGGEEVKTEKERNNDLKLRVTLYACYLYDAVILYAKGTYDFTINDLLSEAKTLLKLDYFQTY